MQFELSDNEYFSCFFLFEVAFFIRANIKEVLPAFDVEKNGEIVVWMNFEDLEAIALLCAMRSVRVNRMMTISVSAADKLVERDLCFTSWDLVVLLQTN